MRLLVADDEQIIREDLIRMIRNRYPSRFEFLQAENGLQALETATAMEPDLILSDIKMPVLSGLEMLSRLRAGGCGTEVIFFSGFDDFAFVRDAMKLGAADYLLKPISEKDLFSLLDHFLENAASKPPADKGDGITREKLEASSVLQQYTIDMLLVGEKRVDEILPFFPVPSSACVLLSGLKSEPSERKTFDGSGCLMLSGQWQQSEILLVLYPQPEVPASPDPSDREAAWGTGSTPAEALKNAKKRMTENFYDVPAESGPEKPPYTGLVSRIAGEACLGHRRECFSILHTLTARAAARQADPESLRQVLYSAVYTILQQKGSFVPVFSRMQLTENDLLQNISKAPKAAALEQAFSDGLSFMMDEVFGREEAPESYHMERARKYILTNYARDLSLADLAVFLELNPNYVSTLFHRECGMPFSQYLRTVRIEQACRLLRETTEKVYLIGEKVGYPDPVHFSRVFREETGLTPKEYRRKSG